MEVKLLSTTLHPVLTCERAAAKCYDSESSESGRIIDACAQNGHLSVWEHMNFTFEIKGISRACLAQLTRHRLAAFSVRSQRYCDEASFNYVTPVSMNGSVEADELYHEAMRYLDEVYQRMVMLGVPQEDARYVLPNACTTQLVVTMNGRELMHFCNERLCSRAQWEIRQLATAMARQAGEAVPQIRKWLVPKCEKNLKYPACPERQCCGRHKKISEVYHDAGAV